MLMYVLIQALILWDYFLSDLGAYKIGFTSRIVWPILYKPFLVSTVSLPTWKIYLNWKFHSKSIYGSNEYLVTRKWRGIRRKLMRDWQETLVWESFLPKKTKEKIVVLWQPSLSLDLWLFWALLLFKKCTSYEYGFNLVT